ncbi:unnamed protein product [Darwinula stevensoni]|uniref:Transposase n=1 Tax=Darwinula stevensoni TaxID=69355 RepID=A0A7R9A9I0_9CRUS|nr:unnamed protein product [Darwinula stevensoni]CAG0897384.1 unnamed protein product [Darwinula stevensoni]
MLALPFVTENPGFRSAVYAVEPTLQMGRLFMEEIQEYLEGSNDKDGSWKDFVHLLPLPFNQMGFQPIMAHCLTLCERSQLASCYKVRQSMVQVQGWWRNVHGPRASVDAKTIRNCHSKLMNTGSVVDTRKSGRPSTSRHYRRKTDRRMEYGEIMLAWFADWPQLFNNIVWSDEAVFHVGGFVNRHSCHYWAREDPGATVEKMQNRPKVTVWCSLTSNQVVDPFLIRDTADNFYHSTVGKGKHGWEAGGLDPQLAKDLKMCQVKLGIQVATISALLDALPQKLGEDLMGSMVAGMNKKPTFYPWGPLDITSLESEDIVIQIVEKRMHICEDDARLDLRAKLKRIITSSRNKI